MTQEEFIVILDEKGHSYEIVGNKIVVTQKGYVELYSLTSLPPGVVFRNGGNVNLESLTGDCFYNWKGNIKGIESNRLLNLMISKGIFERR